MEIILSIVTVVKNANSTLARTLNSVAGVKRSDIEYIIVDGGSIDGTVELIRSFGQIVDKFISEPDTGIYNAMNKGLNLATGKYILFINGDDELLQDGFLVVLPLLMKGAAKVISAKSKVLSNGNATHSLTPKPWQLLFFNSIPHPSTFVLTSLLRKYRFREDLFIAWDYDLFLRLFLDGYRFIKVDTIIALHHRGGASSNSFLSIAEVEQIRLERIGGKSYRFLNIALSVYRMCKSFLHIKSK